MSVVFTQNKLFGESASRMSDFVIYLIICDQILKVKPVKSAAGCNHWKKTRDDSGMCRR